MRRATLAILVLALASMGQRCDPNRACPTGMQPAPSVSVEDIVQALRDGFMGEALCVCRDGFERIDPEDWRAGCRPVTPPTTTTTTTLPEQPTPTPTATPTPEPTPAPTPPPIPTPTPCVESVTCTAAGMAGEFRSRQAACDARRDYMERQGHLQKRIVGGVPWWNLSAGVWLDQACLVYDAPNGHRRPNKTFGISCEVSTPCPEPTPTPPPGPTPTPDIDCDYTHFNLVWLCAEPSKPGCLDGKDWGRPGIVHINRDGKPICKVDGEWRMCVRAFLTAVLFNDREKIERGHACFPGPIPEGSWEQSYPPDLRFDCGDPWGDGWNNGSCNIDFAARNDFGLCAFGVCGETSMTSDWR